MNKIAKMGLFMCAVALVGCGDRAVVGETSEGLRRGGSTLKVSGDAPPRDAPGDGSDLPARTGSLRESDPWVRAQLAQSGTWMQGPAVEDVFQRVPAALPAEPAPTPEAAPATDAEPIAP